MDNKVATTTEVAMTAMATISIHSEMSLAIAQSPILSSATQIITLTLSNPSSTSESTFERRTAVRSTAMPPSP